MANLADYGASVDSGASFAVMAAAVVSLMFVGAVEIVLAAAGSAPPSACIIALVGFAVQGAGRRPVRLHHAASPQRSVFVPSWRVVVGYRILRCNPWSAAEVTHRVARATHRGLPPYREARVVSWRLGPARDRIREAKGRFDAGNSLPDGAWLNDTFAAFDATILGAPCARRAGLRAHAPVRAVKLRRRERAHASSRWPSCLWCSNARIWGWLIIFGRHLPGRARHEHRLRDLSAAAAIRVVRALPRLVALRQRRAETGSRSPPGT